MLVGEPKDIGPLIKELYRDIEAEAMDIIKDALYEAFRKNVLNQAIIGFPEWYRARLASGG